MYSVKPVADSNKTGTIVTFIPDNTIFVVSEYNYEILQSRLRELSFLNAGIKLTLTDRREKDDDGKFISEIFIQKMV